MIEPQIWQKVGIKFLCIACGRCCLGKGLVYLYPKDLEAMANHLKISKQKFADKFCAVAKVVFDDETIDYLVLKNDDNRCIFLDENDKLCTIHEAKPYQCRQSPFMAEFLLTDEGLNHFKQICPGIGIGKLHPKVAIDTYLKLQEQIDEQYMDELFRANNGLDTIFGIDTSSLKVYVSKGEAI